MASYVIVSKGEDYVHCDVTMDDGSTFGQHIQGERRLTLAGIDAAITEAVERMSVKAEVTLSEVDLAISAKTSFISKASPVLELVVK